jgi:glycosyltransferase involved in cell wall biosynthesis
VHPLAPPLQSAAAQFAAIPDDRTVLVDGLAFGSMPEIIEREAWRLRFVPIVHMPLAATPGLTPGDAGWLSNLERRALVHARHVVITGLRTKLFARATSAGATNDQITRIPPGTEPVTSRRDRRAPGTGPLRLLCVANLTFGKGHDILLRGLATVRDADWRLVCAGSVTRDSQMAEGLRALARDLELESRVEWLGELDDERLAHEYERADLFVLPTRGETYGMAVAEAIAHGLPVVSTRTGEIPTMTGTGALLAEAGDVAGFATLLTKALGDPSLRQKLGDGAAEAADRLPTWDQTTDAMADVLARVAARE